MTVSQKRTVITLGLFAGILAVAFLLLSLARIGYAHADGSGGSAVALIVDAGVAPGPAAPIAVPGTSVPHGDPVVIIDPGHPVESAQSLWQLLHDQGWVWGGLGVLLAVGSFLAKKNEEAHWIHTPWLLAGGTATLTILGAILNAHFGSASWASTLPLILAGIALMWKKPEPKATP